MGRQMITRGGFLRLCTRALWAAMLPSLVIGASPTAAQEAEGGNADRGGRALVAAKLAASPRRSEWVTIQRNGRTLKAWVDYPQVAGKVPVVVVLHEVSGLTDYTRITADQVAAMGYIAVVPDMLSGFGPNGAGTASLGGNAGSTLVQREDVDVYPDLEAWMDYGNALPQANGKVGIVGLTWGGAVAFRYAVGKPRPDLKAVFVFCIPGPPVYNQGTHATKLINDWPVKPTKVPVYGFYGEYDITTATPTLLSIEDSKRVMKAAGNFYDPVIYPRAEHAFLRMAENPDDPNPGNAVAAKASLIRLERLLKTSLR